MSKRTIEIDDTLQEQVDSAIEEVKSALLEYLKDNPDTDNPPDWNDLDYSGTLHDIIDSAVPIYTHAIDTAFFLYGDVIEAAFDNAGIGDKNDESWPCGWKPAAIYCYIEQQVQEWFSDNAEDIFTTWKDEQKAVQ